MSRPLRIASIAAAVCLVSACGPPRLEELEGRTFSDVADFQDAVSCSEFFQVFPSWGGDAPVVDQQGEALEMAESLLSPSQPQAVDAVAAGDVWLLIDSDGRAFAAMESVGASIGGCAG